MSASIVDQTAINVESGIASHILHRTARRVTQLGVQRDGERILVTGTVPNYHVKQLVIRAIQEIQASDAWSGPLDVGVDVAPGNSTPNPIETSANLGGWEEQLDDVLHAERCRFANQGLVSPRLRNLVARWLPTR